MEYNRVWCMPNKDTFVMKPIAELLKCEVTGGLWIDPFCGKNSPATMRNDINPEIDCESHVDALEFLQMYSDTSVDGVLFDPPYSVRQVAECYKQFGYKVTQETTRSDFYTKLKREISRIVKPGGKVICFGWNSGGVGKTFDFELSKILLCPHGGVHNDTIVTVEHKLLS